MIRSIRCRNARWLPCALWFPWIVLPAGTDAISQTVLFKQLDRQVIEARLRVLPKSNEKRKEALENLFRETGCPNEQLTEQPIKHSRYANILCTVPGETDSVIIVGGHYDMAEIGRGAVDNWSGASLLPSLYESLKGEPRRHKFVFAGFYGEEEGLTGSQFYVKQFNKDQLAGIAAMVNLDSLGLSSTKVEIDRSDRRLANILAGVARKSGFDLSLVNVSRVGMSDNVSFTERKVPSISIHSVTQETLRILHSTRDNLEAISLNDYYDTYRLLVTYLAVLDVMLDGRPE